MAVHHGKNGKVKLTTNVVAEVTRWSANETVEVASSTAMGDTSQTHIAGIPGWTASVAANYDPADTNGQVALTIGASVTLGLYSDGDGVGKKYLSGTATVTSISYETDLSDIVKFSIELTGNGPLSVATVPS